MCSKPSKNLRFVIEEYLSQIAQTFDTKGIIASFVFMDAGDIMEHEMKPNEQDQTTNQKTDDSLKRKQVEKFNVPSKKWNKMLEKARLNQSSLLYVFVAVLAVMFVWLKFLGWSENWKFWEWFGDHMK
ncbi:10416_t:CDS:2 [Cetraspora pellucida]|uniref:10416_t:CDS:1 n=1 Tax=Cetraspora pellucida TaxID=1433469 RepID=A0A9N9EKV6_9GLOM|nr:10416_t:CDS:2 [Cetraspora pellucida]